MLQLLRESNKFLVHSPELIINQNGKTLDFYSKILISVQIVIEYIIPGAVMVISIAFVFGHARRNYNRYAVPKV